jgi:hypothetical protein
MSQAVALMAEIVGEEYARAMAVENPLAVVEGRSIPSVPNPELPKKKRRWGLFG